MAPTQKAQSEVAALRAQVASTQTQLTATEEQVKVLREDNNRLEAALAVERGARDPDALKKARHELHLVNYRLARVLRIFDEFKVKRPDIRADLRTFVTDEYLRDFVASVEERIAVQCQKDTEDKMRRSDPPRDGVAMVLEGARERDGAVVLEGYVEPDGAVMLEGAVSPKRTIVSERSRGTNLDRKPEDVQDEGGTEQPKETNGHGNTKDAQMTDVIGDWGGITEPDLAEVKSGVVNASEQPENNVIQNMHADPSTHTTLAAPIDSLAVPSQNGRDEPALTPVEAPPVIIDETNPAAEVLKILIGAASVAVYDAPRRVKVEMINEAKEREVSFFLSWSGDGMTFSKDTVRLEERDRPEFLNEDCIEFDFSQAPTFLVLVMSAVHGFALQNTSENPGEPERVEESTVVDKTSVTS